MTSGPVKGWLRSAERKEMTVMTPLCICDVYTDHGMKSVEVYCADVCAFDQPIDILTTSAFQGSYIPTPGRCSGRWLSMGSPWRHWRGIP